MSSSSASLLPRSLVVACFVSGKMAAMIMFNKDDGYAEAVVRGYKTQGAGAQYSQTSFFLEYALSPPNEFSICGLNLLVY